MKEVEMVFKALADGNRLRIIKLLEQRPLCVCEIAFVLGVSQPAVSKHLKKMKDAGIVSCAQDGFWTNYCLRRENGHVKALLKDLRGRLNDDLRVTHDRLKIQKADRARLCCRKGS